MSSYWVDPDAAFGIIASVGEQLGDCATHSAGATSSGEVLTSALGTTSAASAWSSYVSTFYAPDVVAIWSAAHAARDTAAQVVSEIMTGAQDAAQVAIDAAGWVEETPVPVGAGTGAQIPV